MDEITIMEGARRTQDVAEAIGNAIAAEHRVAPIPDHCFVAGFAMFIDGIPGLLAEINRISNVPPEVQREEDE